MNKEYMINFLKKTGLSPKRARQMYRAKLNALSKEQDKLPMYMFEMRKELDLAMSETIEKLVYLNQIIKEVK